jgi:hypothetical protein
MVLSGYRDHGRKWSTSHDRPMGAAVETLSFLDVAQRTSNTLRTDPPSSEQEVIEAVGVDPVRVRPTGLQARAAWLGGGRLDLMTA